MSIAKMKRETRTNFDLGSFRKATEPQTVERTLSGDGMTPVLVLSRSSVRRSLAELSQALPRAEIHYAIKSNNHPAVLTEVHEFGAGFDVCSVGEVEDAIRWGATPTDLIHSHPIKSDEEFDGAVARGIETFVVDNHDEVAKLQRQSSKRLKILIRFRTDLPSKAIVNLQYKYGCAANEVLPLAESIERSGHRFYGLTFHVGSQCVHSENYVKAIEAASKLIRQLDEAHIVTRLLDIGGGFPVRYCVTVPTIEEICAPIRKALSECIHSDIRVICEPGRFISAGAAGLISSVVGRALRDGRMWYYLDDGLYSTFSGMLYDQCQYEVIPAVSKNGKMLPSVLAGPTCDSFDVMYDNVMLPELNIGERLLFPMTGAYCSVSGSRFNSLRQARYLVVD